MGKSRCATDALNGYFYQFDYTILQLLQDTNNKEFVVEGIEDVDIQTATTKTAVQLKYYDKTDYNHSVIKPAVVYMFEDFMERKKNSRSFIYYKIYGHYKSGSDKLPNNIDADFVKTNFLSSQTTNTYTINDIQDFLDYFKIDNKASNIEEQNKKIISAIKFKFNCDDFDADYIYYANALKIIRSLAIERNINDRKITSEDFCKRIDKKNSLFDKWFIEKKTVEKYCKAMKKKYFPAQLNLSPFSRFFLIEISDDTSIPEMKDILLYIQRKYSKLSQKEPKPFIPYIYFHNISKPNLVKLKQSLYEEDCKFVDGYDFLGAKFDATSISRHIFPKDSIKIRIISKLNQLKSILECDKQTKEIYQFYMTNIYYKGNPKQIKQCNIFVKSIGNIREIL